MPELPEVETARRNLVRWLKGGRVTQTAAAASRTFRGAQRALFLSLRGKLVCAERKGKYLMLAFEGDRGLLAHLGMTGKFVRRKVGEEVPYSRAQLTLDNGTVVHFRDPRSFGRLEPCAASGLHTLRAIVALGPDALLEERTGPTLERALSQSRKDLKVALMDQGLIAGLGNIHAAEALFRARLHPARKPASLDAQAWARLATAIQATLQFGLKVTAADEVRYVEEGKDVENPFLVYGKKGRPCSHCGTPIASFTQGGRTTYYCPKDQPKAGGGRRPRRTRGRTAER